MKSSRSARLHSELITRLDSRIKIARITIVALSAIQQVSDHLFATFIRRHPLAVHPGWIMTNMLMMPALQLGNPMVLVVLMKTDDLLLHFVAQRGWRRSIA